MKNSVLGRKGLCMFLFGAFVTTGLEAAGSRSSSGKSSKAKGCPEELIDVDASDAGETQTLGFDENASRGSSSRSSSWVDPVTDSASNPWNFSDETSSSNDIPF